MESARIQKISKALADPTRLRIYQAIASKHEVTCGDLLGAPCVTPATVSHHLRILADAGLIECRRKGQFIHNRAVRETITEYTRALAHIADGKNSRARKVARNTPK